MVRTEAISPIAITRGTWKDLALTDVKRWLTRAATVPTTPAIPVSPAQNITPVSPSPGNWSHPQWKEIAKRQRAQVFDQTNVNRIIVNATVLLITFYRSRLSELAPASLHTYILNPIASLNPIAGWALFFLRIILAINIIHAFKPFYSHADNIPDVDLNAAQRRLMGLDPRATPPPTTNTKYVTPPRYPVSSTPRSASTGTPGSRGSFASSFNGADTPSRSPLGRHASDSGTRPAGSGHDTEWKSPLYRRQAAERRYRDQRKMEERLNEEGPFGRTSTPPRRTGNLFARGASPAESTFAPSTPSPNRHPTVRLNDRWAARRSGSGSGSFT